MLGLNEVTGDIYWESWIQDVSKTTLTNHESVCHTFWGPFVLAVC